MRAAFISSRVARASTSSIARARARAAFAARARRSVARRGVAMRGAPRARRRRTTGGYAECPRCVRRRYGRSAHKLRALTRIIRVFQTMSPADCVAATSASARDAADDGARAASSRRVAIARARFPSIGSRARGARKRVAEARRRRSPSPARRARRAARTKRRRRRRRDLDGRARGRANDGCGRDVTADAVEVAGDAAERERRWEGRGDGRRRGVVEREASEASRSARCRRARERAGRG